MSKEIKAELIERIKKNSYEKPDFIVEDLETLDFKERNGSIVIDYSYQRNFIQSEKSVSKYVESVFLGLIIPEIQIYDNQEKGYREIIDGQQRLLSLLKFLRGEYKLRGLTHLTVLNGMRFKDLPQELQTIYKQFCVNMRVAKNPSEDYKYLLFERLNVGSKPLNQQEVRNCVFKNNPILKMTRKISNNESIVQLFEEIGRVKNNRFLRDEFIIGILSIRYGDLSLRATLMKNRINDYLMSTNNMPQEEVETIFTELFDIVELLITKFDLETIIEDFLFRKSIIEAVIVAMWKVEDKTKLEDNVKDIEMAILEALHSEEFNDSIATGESQSNKEVIRRVNLVLNGINKVIA